MKEPKKKPALSFLLFIRFNKSFRFLGGFMHIFFSSKAVHLFWHDLDFEMWSWFWPWPWLFHLSTSDATYPETSVEDCAIFDRSHRDTPYPIYQSFNCSNLFGIELLFRVFIKQCTKDLINAFIFSRVMNFVLDLYCRKYSHSRVLYAIQIKSRVNVPRSPFLLSAKSGAE